MAKMKFKLNRDGVRSLMQSAEMQQVLKNYADTIADRAGDGYDVHIGPNRANVSVQTANAAAVQDNLDNNTLLKAVR